MGFTSHNHVCLIQFPNFKHKFLVSPFNFKPNVKQWHQTLLGLFFFIYEQSVSCLVNSKSKQSVFVYIFLLLCLFVFLLIMPFLLLTPLLPLVLLFSLNNVNHVHFGNNAQNREIKRSKMKWNNQNNSIKCLIIIDRSDKIICGYHSECDWSQILFYN